MGIGASIFLIAIGAILAFAVDVSLGGLTSTSSAGSSWPRARSAS